LCMHHAPLDTALYLWLVPHWHVLIRCPVLDKILVLPFFHYEQKLQRLLLQWNSSQFCLFLCQKQ
jgi:hypothetical protein